VAKSTFYAHQKQQRLDRNSTYNSSDADDDDSYSGTESSLTWPRLSPLLQEWGPRQTPEVESRRVSPYPRGERPGSQVSTVLESSPADSDWGVESDVEGGVQDAVADVLDDATPQVFDDAAADVFGDGAAEVLDDAAAEIVDDDAADVFDDVPADAEPEDENSYFDDIQEAVFSNFDIEDLLYAAHIEVEPWLKLGIVLLRWKSRKNISTHAYNELRSELSQCLGIKVPSDRTIITHLQSITGLFPVKIDCCMKGCQAYVGRYRRAKRCSSCAHPRYQEEQPGDDECPEVNVDDSDQSDDESYADDLDENSQVRT
jgi:hypothetical protein